MRKSAKPNRKRFTGPLITHFGQFWERTDLFEVSEHGRVSWSARSWLGDKAPHLAGRKGIYILYKGTTPLYVGKGTGRYGVALRLKNHARDWYSHAWDNVCWYVFRDDVPTSWVEAVEALLVASIPDLLNGAQPAGQLGKRCYPGKDKNYASNKLWRKTAEARRTA